MKITTRAIRAKGLRKSGVEREELVTTSQNQAKQ